MRISPLWSLRRYYFDELHHIRSPKVVFTLYTSVIWMQIWLFASSCLLLYITFISMYKYHISRACILSTSFYGGYIICIAPLNFYYTIEFIYEVYYSFLISPHPEERSSQMKSERKPLHLATWGSLIILVGLVWAEKWSWKPNKSGLSSAGDRRRYTLLREFCLWRRGKGWSLVGNGDSK